MMRIPLKSRYYKDFILMQVPRYFKVSRILTADSYTWMFVNLQQRPILHNIIFKICKFFLNFSLTRRDRVAQWKLEYPISIYSWSSGCIGLPWIKSEQVKKVIWKMFLHMVGYFNKGLKFLLSCTHNSWMFPWNRKLFFWMYIYIFPDNDPKALPPLRCSLLW